MLANQVNVFDDQQKICTSIHPYYNILLDSMPSRKEQKKTKYSSSALSSSSSSSSMIAAIKTPKRKPEVLTVDLVFVDANDRGQLPGNELNIHDMKEHGNYHENYLMSDAVSFNSFLKLNLTFEELFAKDW